MGFWNTWYHPWGIFGTVWVIGTESPVGSKILVLYGWSVEVWVSCIGGLEECIVLDSECCKG